MKPDRIVIGAESERAFKLLRNLYEPFVRQGNPIIEMDIRSAEVTKYAANSYLATRITFMNELANFCEKSGANVDLVRKGMGSDTRIGKRFLFPGIGYGGSCFPKDVNALIKTSLDFGSELKLLTLVDKINKEQRLRFFTKILNHFNGDLKGKKFAVWGLAFKPNTDDMREAPSVPVINLLLESGARVRAFDPASMENAKFYLNDSIEYAQNMYDALPESDALIIFTEWNEFRNPDFKRVKSLLKKPVIFDGRNVYDLDDMEEYGFTYYSIGRKPVMGMK
jgi:UDPglucose 6-dehydrogenase